MFWQAKDPQTKLVMNIESVSNIEKHATEKWLGKQVRAENPSMNNKCS